ncbi:MAG: RagB/SusD family nutrient uptake outer membrane protein [Sediminicola sp.]
MQKTRLIKTLFLLAVCASSCEDYVEVDVPDHKMVREVVFNNDETALSAMKGIYNELFRSSFSSGNVNSVTALAGLSAHEIGNLSATNLTAMEFEANQILPNNPSNHSLWSGAYNMVYMANAVLEGTTASDQLSEGVRDQLEGEAKFIRAFAYLYLVNLYGEVPLLLTTDYRTNAVPSRDTVGEVYDQIISDLNDAVALLDTDYREGERTHVNRYVAMALLARTTLYTEKWEQAENWAGQLIDGTSDHELLADLDQVFLKNSREAIWQISPIGRGNIFTNTNDGNLFISAFPSFYLAKNLADSFEDGDKRALHWVGFNEGRNEYHPFKYKDGSSTNNITEYTMVLRLAEQYLIRAEARAMQGNLTGAIDDLDRIRQRAGLPLLAETDPAISRNAFLDILMEERKKELFTEWGHRWFDLKRTGRASDVLGTNNPLWQDTDVLFPVPEEERLKNPNLGQNQGQ